MAYFNEHIKRSRWSSRIGAPASFRSYDRSLRLLGNNDGEAFRLNVIAAEQGMHDAVLAMGWFYLNGVGVETNEGEAVRWYRKSARQGEERAMFSLGYIAYVRKDFSDALVWFKRALNKGHHRSNYWIGKMYWRGEGVVQNRKLGQEFFEQAASGKVVEAQRALRFLGFLASGKKTQTDKLNL